MNESGLLKRIELAGRRLLVGLLAWLFRSKASPVTLGHNPRILVVRIDPRVGNAVMSTPLLASLRARFPGAQIELLGHPQLRPLLQGHAAVDVYLDYRKGALLSADGPLRTPGRLRRRGYDLAIDAGNPTDPSLTAARLVSRCGATHRVGARHPLFEKLYTASALPAASATHEIDLRLSVLDILPGQARIRELGVAHLQPPPTAAAMESAYAVVNVGAGRADKTLSEQGYADVVRRVQEHGFVAVLTYGPRERAAAATIAESTQATMAPPTDLVALCAWLGGAEAAIACDTGPMHLAVALGTPTCAMFSTTDPARYGYTTGPHHVVRANEGAVIDTDTLDAWLKGLATPGAHTARSGQGTGHN